MEKGKVNELFRSKFGNQRLRGFIKTRTKLLPSIKTLPSLCKCLTKETRLFLVLPAVHGGFRGAFAAPCGWTPLPKQEPSAPTAGTAASDFSTSSSLQTQVWHRNNHPPPKFGPASPFIQGQRMSFSKEKQNCLSLRH